MNYTKNEVLQYIAENDVKFIKLFFTDVFGNTKSISIQPAELERAFETGISFDASAVPGFLNVNESDLFLVPDENTLSILPWRPQHGRVVRFFCNIRYPDGRPFEGDMRHLLEETLEKANSNGYEVSIGTECEFYLFQLDENGEPTKKPVDKAGYCDLAPKDKGENVRRSICLMLEQMGISPETSHHESGPGQQEVDFRYSSALTAADNLSTFKTIVSTVAASNGLYASFNPKPLDNEAGNGLHINISVKKNGKNIFAGSELSKEAEYFIAGILKHIKEISLFLNPIKDSYKRLGSHEAPKFISWSHQNRSQLIRIPAAANDSMKRIELRSPDPACNQYTALLLLINAGLDGIENEVELMPENNENLYSAAKEVTEKLETLPATFEEAKSIAKNSDFINKILPKVTVEAFSNFNGIAADL